MAHTHFEPEPQGGTNTMQIILIFIAGVFYWLRSISAHEFQQWTFWTLSVLSLLLTISLKIRQHRDLSQKNNSGDEA